MEIRKDNKGQAMEDILSFMSGIFPLIEEEFDANDPDKIGPKTSKYISIKLQPDRLNPEDAKSVCDSQNPIES